MIKPWTLRLRVVLTYTLLTAAVSSLFAALVYITVQEVENDLVYSRLGTQTDWFIERYRQGASLDAAPGMRFYYGPAVPPAFASLSPGIYEEFREGRAVHILVRDDNGQRFVVVDEQSRFWVIETYVNIALLGGILVSLALAMLLARLTVNRVIAPLTALAQAVDSQRPSNAFPFMDSRDEIGTLARAFAQRAGVLEAFLARERAFTSDASHELRTPLTIIVGAAEVLASHAQKQASLRPLAERIGRAAADATERVSALLLLARFPESIDAPLTELAPIVEREADRCLALLSGKPVSLDRRIDKSVQALARPELVSMLVANIVRNACQYTDEGTVTVALSPGLLRVEDTGPGLPPSVRARLFERFVRGSEAGASGAGLGLSIAQRVAVHLRWRLEIQDREDGGTQVSLWIPSQ